MALKPGDSCYWEPSIVLHSSRVPVVVVLTTVGFKLTGRGPDSGLLGRAANDSNFDEQPTRLNSKLTPLNAELATIIGMRGPISVAEFMRQALAHPVHGYHDTNESMAVTRTF